VGNKNFSIKSILTLILLRIAKLNKILLAMIVGLFTLNTYAADLPKADAAKVEPAKAVEVEKADATKKVAEPAKKAKKVKKVKKVKVDAAKTEAPASPASAK
jgi:uncharacterized protein (DUF58 family)